jgi:hypothetical protein
MQVEDTEGALDFIGNDERCNAALFHDSQPACGEFVGCDGVG